MNRDNIEVIKKALPKRGYINLILNEIETPLKYGISKNVVRHFFLGLSVDEGKAMKIAEAVERYLEKKSKFGENLKTLGEKAINIHICAK